jgi:hypothetical protein
VICVTIEPLPGEIQDDWFLAGHTWRLHRNDAVYFKFECCSLQTSSPLSEATICKIDISVVHGFFTSLFGFHCYESIFSLDSELYFMISTLRHYFRVFFVFRDQSLVISFLPREESWFSWRLTLEIIIGHSIK